MSETDPYVIIGAGQAGGRAAQALRQADPDAGIVLIGEEAHVPYERPPLSKDLITTEASLERVQLHAPDWYAENRVELVLGDAATKIDPRAHTVTLASGRSVPYRKLLLATGARVRKLPLPGAELPGVFYLRTIEDTQEIKKRLADGVRMIVIGGGFIGLEIAASGRKCGATVTLLEAADRLMGRSVAPEIGTWFMEMHRKNGVDVRLGQKIDAITGGDRADGVQLGDGTVLPADLIVIGIGIVPNVELASDAGLTVDNGIVVDEYGRTSEPDIYAAGDVANQPNAFTGRRLRLESYQNAQDQAMAVARNMAGAEAAYEDSLWVWSDQHDVNLQMTGIADGYDELVWRGDPDDGAFMVFYLKDGRIIAINTVNAGRDMKAAQRLMQSGKVFDKAKLADPEVKLLRLGKE